MRFVTVAMIAEHAKKSPKSVRRGLKLAGIEPQKFPGILGVRIPEKDANKFLLKHWPAVGPFPAESNN